jgi:hypothetical protein
MHCVFACLVISAAYTWSIGNVSARSDQDRLVLSLRAPQIISSEAITTMPVACDTEKARACQQGAQGCQNLCDHTNRTFYKACLDGCADRYKVCKVGAGCGDYQ